MTLCKPHITFSFYFVYTLPPNPPLSLQIVITALIVYAHAYLTYIKRRTDIPSIAGSLFNSPPELGGVRGGLIRLNFPSAVDLHTPSRHSQYTGNPSADSGRGVPRSGLSDNAGANLLRVAGVTFSEPQSWCRRVDP